MKDTKIFLLAGKARSGKDQTANFIKNIYEEKGKMVVMLGFGDYIKWYAQKITNWNGEDQTKPRELLQILGSDIVRNQINKDFFINRICEDIRVYKYFFDIIIITGARFPNELDIPKKLFKNVTIIKMDRPDFENELTPKQREHITENALDHYSNYDYLLENNGDLEELKNKVQQLVEEVEHEH